MIDRYDYEPLVKGGQGRTDEELGEQANFITEFVLILMILAGIFSLILWAIK